MIPADRNPNTTGAKVLGLCGSKPGARLKRISDGIKARTIRTLICLGEDATKMGITEAELAKVTIIAMDILPNKTTLHATVLLPASAWAEKRGSMVNVKGRLQRLNRAVPAPGHARDDWEILRDLVAAVGGSSSETSWRVGSLTTIEAVFKQMSEAHPEFAGLSLSRIGDLGVEVITPKVTRERAGSGAKLAT
jgi:NADH-quinone oxidoreductase subunit G